MPMVKSLDKKSLGNEYELLFLNYHRNKNQHRSTTWFKYLNLLVRHLRKLLTTKSTKCQQKSISHLVNHVIPKLYFAFNGVVAQGQFITLGFFLVGSLSKIHGLISDLDKKVSRESPRLPLQVFSADSEQDIGEELEVDEARVSNSIVQQPVPKKSKTVGSESVVDKKRGTIDDIFGPEKKKKKKSKKKKSLIDDIFG